MQSICSRLHSLEGAETRKRKEEAWREGIDRARCGILYLVFLQEIQLQWRLLRRFICEEPIVAE